MEQLPGRGERLVVCTLAERPGLALTGSGRWIEVAAEAADVVDTNGVGDAFAASLMVASFFGVPSARRWRSPHVRQPSRSGPASSPRRSVARTRAPRRSMTTCPGRACVPALGWCRDEASNTNCHRKGARTPRTIARMPEPVRKRWWNEIKWVTWGIAMVILIAAAVIFVLLDG